METTLLMNEGRRDVPTGPLSRGYSDTTWPDVWYRTPATVSTALYLDHRAAISGISTAAIIQTMNQRSAVKAKANNA